jgi:predicted short-subunit dehydrogenase-like oxidoreductase (DUF2520 family)
VHDDTQRAFALVGPGRAGGAFARALETRGWRCVAVIGRHDPHALEGALATAELVIVATPDAVIADVAASLADGLAPGALVVHLSGACTLAELDKLRSLRPDVRVGSLHPLQTLPSARVGAERLAGSWCAVDGPAEVERLAIALGMRPFRIDDTNRALYHATATVASNHLVALMGQVTRLAEAAGVPPAALLPLVRATLDNVDALGPAGALTGPIGRGDVDTVARHLRAIPIDERDAYCALAEQALRLTGRDDAAMRELLEEPIVEHAR